MTNDLAKSVQNWFRRLIYGAPGVAAKDLIEALTLSREEAEARRSGGEIEKIFFSGKGRLVHKWIDYLPVYERFLKPYRNSETTMIEIGVYFGGSLDMWRSYLGPCAKIYGIDINSDSANYVDPPNEVRIGSQADPAFLRSVVNEAGRPDIILDDGSHIAKHQLESFRTLWPELQDGGLYIIEDTHTSYWPAYQGGYRRRSTAIDLAKTLIDDMHGWYHSRPSRFVAKEEIGGIHIFDSMIIVEKKTKLRPGHVYIPKS